MQRDFERRSPALDLPRARRRAAGRGRQSGVRRANGVGMSISLLLSIVLVYLLMVALYNSYRTPFVIMFSVPVAVVGALGSLALTHQTLNLFSFIGSDACSSGSSARTASCSSISPTAAARGHARSRSDARERAANASVRL